MIVCVCRRLNDQAVHQAIDAGARSPECVQNFHGCTFNCGKCRPTMASMIEAKAESEDAAPLLMAAE